MRTRSQSLAVALAVVAALVWIGGQVFLRVGDVGRLSDVARQGPAVGSGLLVHLGVVVVGVWLASQREAPRVSLGLGVIASWGWLHLLELRGGLSWLLAGESLSFGISVLVAVGLALAASAVALLALRDRGERYSLGIPGRRQATAGAIALFGLALLGSFLVRFDPGLEVPESLAASALPRPSLGGPLLTLIILMVIAAVVWRSDRLSVVPAPIVVTATGMAIALSSIFALVTGPGAGAMNNAAILFLEVGAVAVLAATTALLAKAARASWQSQQHQ